MKKETLEEYLARGGQIQKVTQIEKPFVDQFSLSRPNINTNKEAYFKYIKRGKEIKNDRKTN